MHPVFLKTRVFFQNPLGSYQRHMPPAKDVWCLWLAVTPPQAGLRFSGSHPSECRSKPKKKNSYLLAHLPKPAAPSFLSDNNTEVTVDCHKDSPRRVCIVLTVRSFIRHSRRISRKSPSSFASLLHCSSISSLFNPKDDVALSVASSHVLPLCTPC